jgi:t-SNARE complex subunit (syntaxin)
MNAGQLLGMVMASAGLKNAEVNEEADEQAFLAKYKITGELGRGSYSVVQAANNRKTKIKLFIIIIVSLLNIMNIIIW